MKVAIITHSLRYNYGGILQNYALQQVLIKLGCNPITLKLGRKDSKKSLIDYIKWLIRKIIHRQNYSLTECQVDYLCQNTDSFINKNIVMSPRMSSIDKKWVLAQNFDGYVVGSDQVLHPASYSHIEEIYLDFVHKGKKIMYAASFGSENCFYTKKQIKKCSKLVKKFDFVGIREDSGLELMKKYFNKESVVVLDPTLLLSAENYKRVFTPNNENYGIVTYLLDPTEQKQHIVDIVSKELHQPIMMAGNDKMDGENNDIQTRIAPSVESWLQKMSQAEFIVTDSYHGTLFAIIFNKNFITIGNKKRGLDRFNTILRLLNLKHRIITDDLNPLMLKDIINEQIPYKYINEELYKLQSLSMQVLMNNL